MRRQPTFRPLPVGNLPPGFEHFTLRDLLRQLLTPEEFAQVAGDGDEPCDVRPEGLPDDTRCRFRKGHTCACRFFGDFEHG